MLCVVEYCTVGNDILPINIVVITYLVPFLRYSALNNGVTLKYGFKAPFNTPHNDFLLVGHCKYSSIFYHFRVI